MRSSDDSSTALPPPPIYNNNAVFDPAGLETAAQFAVKFSQNRNGKLEATRMKENEKHQQAKMQEDMAVARTETQNALKKLRRAEKDVKKELTEIKNNWNMTLDVIPSYSSTEGVILKMESLTRVDAAND